MAKPASTPTRTRGVNSRTLETDHRRQKPREGTYGQVSPPSQEAVRRAVEALICPWCGRGPFVVLSGHTSKMHGIDRFELRDRAGLTYHAVLTPAAYHEQTATQRRERPPPSQSGPRPRVRRMSVAGRASAAERLAAAATLEQKRAAGRAANTPEVAARRAATQATKRAALEHGYKKYRAGCRCDQCKAGNAAISREYRTRRRGPAAR